MMKVNGATHIGLVRESNQDAFFYDVKDKDSAIAIVCDGMGGANGGNVASAIAVKTLKERLEESTGENGKPEYLLASVMAAANVEIYDTAQSRPELDGMGTTVVAVLIRGSVAYVSHVGDSRLYLFRDGSLQAVTRDHSVVQEMIEKGQITEEQAKTHPRKHFITRALGVSHDENGEFDTLDLQNGDRLLLCTDGLTNMADRQVVENILTDSSIEDAVPALIQAALDRGGTDNVTVVLVDIDGI